jgi:hypothetical protein
LPNHSGILAREGALRVFFFDDPAKTGKINSVSSSLHSSELLVFRGDPTESNSCRGDAIIPVLKRTSKPHGISAERRMSGNGAQRKHVTLPTDFHSPSRTDIRGTAS